MTNIIGEKRFKNKNGDLSIRFGGEQGCGIVEIMHYWNENKSGCVVGCWRKVEHKDCIYAQFESIYGRFIELEYEPEFDIIGLLKCGQNLADVIVEFGG